ncbi:hypothetical protein B9Q06_09420 [Candidatus Marsarchaeota G2 archaeon ECH_B_2]|jgi:hypothetical protein|uniref:Uncharacterized protein n=3 Tax=Candidatus Marsarchaeota group 2 TaxID=2203771 RepID=A0A2R6B6U1_9ARCH|nr:MAG: hypothetical protein B9Q06_09420 [Candidatus Marsarchaeota G2 archaeon ECH_B_2]PSN98496.1 MAG: hypothetical protein B9Q07_09530 [Candidatus Marsarchaeota G2 archaeon ECH_B_3]PSO01519.1 MAG: hypothetical protein B9Q05_08750 [Candidatus Marsarchaeota G2 archaeon ECH_B_1]
MGKVDDLKRIVESNTSTINPEEFRKIKRFFKSELPKCPLCGGQTILVGSYTQSGSNLLICMDEACDVIGFRYKSRND